VTARYNESAHISTRKGAVLKLSKVAGFVGGTGLSIVAGYIATALGASLFTSFIIGTIAYGPGIYYCAKYAKRYE
jgi:hypothetical protein